MAKLRYVKTAEEVKAALEGGAEFLESTVRSLRIVYETDAALHAALIPRPLEAAPRPEMCVTLSHVAMHISEDYTFEIGSAVFGARALYDGVEGIYLAHMPMTAEAAVVGGRETYGEPKKIAEIPFERDGDRVASRVQRMGIPYIRAEGRIGEALPARAWTEHAFCIKAFPSCEQGRAFDQDPLLVRLDWRHQQDQRHVVRDGELVLQDSPFDPVADLPVRSLVSMEYEQGRTESNGQVLRSLPPEWVQPFLHGRYDEVGVQGIEV